MSLNEIHVDKEFLRKNFAIIPSRTVCSYKTDSEIMRVLGLVAITTGELISLKFKDDDVDLYSVERFGEALVFHSKNDNLSTEFYEWAVCVNYIRNWQIQKGGEIKFSHKGGNKKFSYIGFTYPTEEFKDIQKEITGNLLCNLSMGNDGLFSGVVSRGKLQSVINGSLMGARNVIQRCYAQTQNSSGICVKDYLGRWLVGLRDETHDSNEIKPL